MKVTSKKVSFEPFFGLVASWDGDASMMLLRDVSIGSLRHGCYLNCLNLRSKREVLQQRRIQLGT